MIEQSLRSIATPIVGVLLFLILWGGALLSLYGDPATPVALSFFGYELNLSLGWQVSISMLFFLFDVYLLFRISNEYSLFNIHTSFAPGLFIALIGGSTFLMPLYSGNICSSMMLLVVYVLLSTYQRRQAISEYLVGFTLLGFMVILSPKWMLLIPFVFMGCRMFQSLTIRTFFTALIGLIIPFWIGAGLLFLFDEFDHFLVPFRELIVFYPIQYRAFSAQQMVGALLLLFFIVPSFLHYPASSFSIKEKARVCYNFLLILSIGVFFIVVLQPSLFNEFFSLFVGIACIFVTQMLLSLHRRSRSIFFFIMIVLYLLYITVPVWRDLLIS